MSVQAWSATTRLGGLRRFAAAISVLTLMGHTFLGFEPSWAQPLMALAVTYSVEALLELVDARANRRACAFLGRGWLDFFLPAHITGLAIAMLLFPGARLAPTVVACAIAIASKSLLRVRSAGRERHVLNPSNFGLTVALLLYPSVGIAPPYQFTAGLDGVGDWVLPAIVIASGSFLNARYTRRWPLISAWLAGFLAQAALRHWFLGASFTAALMPMSGMAFLLFTFYMVTDPPTTPQSVKGQIAFGLAVATCYGLLMVLHVVFGLFFGLTLTCLGRAAWDRLREQRLRGQQARDYELPRAAPAAHSVGTRSSDHARV